MNLNVQSITNKIDQLEIELNKYSIDIACITEHWLNGKIYNKYMIRDYEIASAFCRNRHRHGGTLILVKRNTDYEVLTELNALSSELHIEITAIKTRDAVVVSVYRSPDGNVDEFLNILSELLDAVMRHDAGVFVMGDFNINFLNKSKNRDSLLDLFQSFNLHPSTTQPSRVTAISETCLDNVFTNVDKKDRNLNTVNLHLGDHLAQIVEYKNISDAPASGEIRFARPFTSANLKNFKSLIDTYQWQDIISNKAAAEMSTAFFEIMKNCYEVSFPEKRINAGDNKTRIVSENINNLKNRLDALATVAKVSGNAAVYDEYYRCKQEYKVALDSEIRNTYRTEIETSSNKQKTIWKIVKQTTGKVTKRPRNIDILPDDMNRSFINRGMQAPIQPSADAGDLLAKTNNSVMGSCFFAPVTSHELTDIVAKIKSKNTLDHCGLSTKLLKAIAPNIVDALVMIINSCLIEGIFPNELKIAKVIPIFKKGDRSDPNNFRPISILPSFSKVFEMIIAERLVGYMDKNNCITKNQHGFRKNKSTMTSLTEVMNTIITALDNEEHVAVACCDLSRAFDTVDHEILLNKLLYYGIRGKAHDLLTSYLSNRYQYVEIESRRSGMLPVKCGVPQGSILGPLLFVIYINDLIVNVSADSICLYADDTTLAVKRKNSNELQKRMEVIMKEVEIWFSSNKLKLNPDKTQCMGFTLNRQEAVEHIKVLGLCIDNRLSWLTHINELSVSLTAAVYSIRRVKWVSTHQAARMTYYANFNSAMTYGIQFWGMSPGAERIFILQKRAVRTLCSLKGNETCKNAFIGERILTLVCVYILTICKYVYKNQVDFCRNGDTHKYDTRQKSYLKVPYHRVTATQKCAGFWGTKVFNKLPKSVKALPYNGFVIRIKKHLVENAFYTMEEFLDCAMDE